MINQQKDPLFDAYLTHPCRRLAIPVPTHRQGPRALSLVLANAQGDPRSDHRLAHLQSAACHRDLVRSQHCPMALLHLHGLGEAAVGRCVGSAMARDPKPLGRRAAAAGAGRFDQSENRQEDLRLSEDVRPCGQQQPDALALGADDRHGWFAQDHPRALVLYPLALGSTCAARRCAPRASVCAARRWYSPTSLRRRWS
jgi:hypothetical protein